MKIKKFSEKYIDEMAKLFVEVYSEPGYEWDVGTAKAYLERDYKYYPDFNLMALNEDGEILGAVFCSIDPNYKYKSKLLFVDSLQVKDKFRKQGVGKDLFASIIRKAKEQGFYGVHFLADERLDFPKDWYERLGFEKTNWVEYESAISDINFDLLE